MNEIKKLNSISLGFIIAYFLFNKAIFIYFSGVFLFLSIFQSRVSFLVIKFIDTIFLYLKKFVFVFLSLLAYYIFLFLFMCFWNLFNKSKRRYYFNKSDSTFLDYNEANDYGPW